MTKNQYKYKDKLKCLAVQFKKGMVMDILSNGEGSNLDDNGHIDKKSEAIVDLHNGIFHLGDSSVDAMEPRFDKTMGGKINTGRIRSNFSPLFLSYYDDGNFVWSLDFQNKPMASIVLKGRKPTKGEMAETLISINIGDLKLDLFMMFVELAEHVVDNTTTNL